MDALQATGYDGLLSLEIFNDQFRAGSARSVAVDGHRSLIFMLDQPRAATEPQPNLPAAAAAALARASAPSSSSSRSTRRRRRAFEALLAGLGFRQAGQHISKAVTRWTQGEINIVTNTREGRLRPLLQHHRTARRSCAIGLEVDDAAATLERAQQLLDTPFRQAVGPGELEIPAVRGLGGSLVYFTDPKSDLARVWDIEFQPVPTGRSQRRTPASRPSITSRSRCTTRRC